MSNLFVVGPVASGDSFFGREKEIRELTEAIFEGSGSVNLIGATRVGKTSLVNEVYARNTKREKCLSVKVSMAECTDAKDFWYMLSARIRAELKSVKQWDEIFEEYFNEIKNPVELRDDDFWYQIFRQPFKSILERVRQKGYRLVLTIDEFDSVTRTFGNLAYHYQLLASLYSEPDYATCGVLISRRRLHLLEKECNYISTLHGKFNERPLAAFSDQDMAAFHELLELHDIKINDKGKARFEYCTGRLPYLCCLLGERMVSMKNELGDTPIEYNEEDIKKIFNACLPMIDRFYEDLIKQLTRDSFLEFVFYLSVDAKLPNVTARDIENMKQMGVLRSELNRSGVPIYYAFSKDFMTYFKLKPLELPVWDTIMSSEKRLKGIFAKEYPELHTTTYDNLIGSNSDEIQRHIKRIYSGLYIDWDKIIHDARKLSMRKNHVTVLDVMTLSVVINAIIKYWDTKFFRHFGGDKTWIAKLELIRDVRNPAAHNQLDCIDKEELADCLQYCREIIQMR